MYFKLPPPAPPYKVHQNAPSYVTAAAFGPGSPSPTAAYPLVDPDKPTPAMAQWESGTPDRELAEILPELFTFKTRCPVDEKCDYREKMNLSQAIQHLNDEHCWSREAIAYWLDTLDVDLTFKREAEPDGTENVTDTDD